MSTGGTELRSGRGLLPEPGEGGGTMSTIVSWSLWSGRIIVEYEEDEEQSNFRSIGACAIVL